MAKVVAVSTRRRETGGTERVGLANQKEGPIKTTKKS